MPVYKFSQDGNLRGYIFRGRGYLMKPYNNTGSRRTRRGCSSWLTISLKHKDELWQPSRQLLHQPVFLVDSENELLLTIISTEQSTVLINSRGEREWLSAFPFLPIPISFNTIPNFPSQPNVCSHSHYFSI